MFQIFQLLIRQKRHLIMNDACLLCVWTEMAYICHRQQVIGLGSSFNAIGRAYNSHRRSINIVAHITAKKNWHMYLRRHLQSYVQVVCVCMCMWCTLYIHMCNRAFASTKTCWRVNFIALRAREHQSNRFVCCFQNELIKTNRNRHIRVLCVLPK